MLQKFVKLGSGYLYFCTFFGLLDDGETRCQTYESLAEALTVILWELRKELTVLEKEMVKQGKNLLL